MSEGEAADASLLLLEAQVAGAKAAVSGASAGSASRAAKKAAGATLRLLDKAAKAHRRALRSAAKSSFLGSSSSSSSGGGSFVGAEGLKAARDGCLCFGERLFVAADLPLALSMAELYLSLCGDSAGAAALVASAASAACAGSPSGGGGGGKAPRKVGGDKGEGLERALELAMEVASLAPSVVDAHLLAAQVITKGTVLARYRTLPHATAAVQQASAPR